MTMAPSYTDYPAIAAAANDFFREYDGTRDFSYVESESVELVSPEREGEARRRVERLTGEGVALEFLDAAEAASAYPRFDFSSFAGVVRHDETGFCDPETFAETLAADASDAGATFETGVEVTGLAAEDGVVRGAETTDGVRESDAVVAAAGWRTPDLLAPHLRLPVRPYRTQCAVYRPDPPLTADHPMGWVPGEHVYFRRMQNDEDLLVGGWSVAEDAPESASRESDEAFRDHVRALVPTFLTGFDDPRLVDHWAGVDAATPDTRPIVDAPADAPEGLVVATGFHGRGIMTAPVAATAVRSLLTGADAPFSLDPFRLDRFDSRSAEFEFHSISDGDS
ncbi:Glycine/D-amino acid oxidase [Halopelagius inordinatus]|uniref:Glycine/D-amino acid oxidase n=1 Tax=Halopelagius inordinatus TaxID=553467 RepID=A0A1I2SCW3_9EURY|nr:Glycine/D-amino acid oxidase [Halopelagius inordinatus]